MADDSQGFDPPGFAENFGFLRDNGVIPPEYPAAAVPQEVKVIIADLSQEEMDRLVNICLETQSFLYIDVQSKSDRGDFPGGIICGF